MLNLDDVALRAFNGPPGNQNQKDIQDALLRYFTLKKTYDLEKDTFDAVTGTGGSHEQLNSTDDLNRVEEGHSSNHILAALGINLEGRLRSTSRKTPRGLNDLLHSAEPPSPAEGLLPFYKEAHYVPSGRGGGSAIRRVLGLR